MIQSIGDNHSRTWQKRGEDVRMNTGAAGRDDALDFNKLRSLTYTGSLSPVGARRAGISPRTGLLTPWVFGCALGSPFVFFGSVQFVSL